MIKQIGFANWLALGAALLLALAFFFLPILEIPVAVEGADAVKTAITGSNLVLGAIPSVDYQLPAVNWLGAAVIAALLGAVVSFLPILRRTARILAQVAGLVALLSYGTIPLFFTGNTNVNLAQSLGSGFWLGALASIFLILQGFVSGKSDKLSETFSEFRKNVHISRKQVLAAVLLVIGIISVVHSLSITPEVNSVLTFTAGRFGVEAGVNLPFVELPVPSAMFLLFTGSVMALVGILAIVNPKNLENLSNLLMIIAGIMVFPLVLIWAATGNSINASTILTESLRTATPIAIGAMAGIWCERSGVVNIAVEGMMLVGAAMGFTVLFFLRNSFPEQNYLFHMVIAVIGAIACGGLVALLHAWLSITFGIDQIVSGTVINILALGSTSYLRAEVLLSNLSGTNRLPQIKIPFLSDLPGIGSIFSAQPIFYAMFLVIILTHIVLFQTRWGLRTRAVGENPHAADTLGIKVNQMRWINVFIGGMIAGLAGAWFSLESSGRFTDGMTDGKGFISLAAMIFGKWTPAGSFVGALLFGFSEVMGNSLQILGLAVAPQFLQMVPYLVTLVVLAGLVGRAIPPKAVGKPYKKEE
jgi:general nucleoside transport system permease protein